MSGAAFRLRMLAVTAALGFAAAFLFLGFPGLDPAISGFFYGADGRFVLSGPGPAEGIRQLFIWALRALAVGALIGAWISAARRSRFLTFGLAEWVFIIILLIVGPGMVANSILKEEWGRPRPREIVEFGGEKPFTPPLLRTDLCESNCSFIGGEASSAFAVGLGLALVAPTHRLIFVVGGIAAGLLVGLIRIGQGGHFTSDIIFAGVFMGLSAVLCHWIVFNLLARWLADDAPARARLQRGCAFLTGGPAKLFNRMTARRHRDPMDEKPLLKDCE